MRTKKMQPNLTTALPDRPSNVRWLILAVLTLIMVVTAFGRLNLGISAKYLQEEFQFTTQTMGWILGAFAFGYALFQIPWGWAGDRFGPRLMLTIAVLCWSTFTMLMAVVPLLSRSHWWHLAWAFGVIRFLTGAGEAASYPNANKIVAHWTTKSERGMGSSLLLAGVGAGGALSPILFAATMQRWGWRSSFLLTGTLAAAVALVWFVYATNRPEENARVNAGELAILGSASRSSNAHSFHLSGTPWRKIFSSGSVWGLIFSYFCHGYAPYIYFTWFFIYLTRVRGFTVIKGGLWGATPFIAMTLMAPLGGWLSDKAVVRFGRRRGRQSTASIGMTCSALLLWAGSHAADNIFSVLLLAAAAGFSTFAAPSWWATCIDLTPNHSGALSGLMNTCANLAGGIAPILTAGIATSFGWTKALDFAALVNLTAAIAWTFVNANENLEADTNTRTPLPAQVTSSAASRPATNS
jgi:ACS family glucarate transporter-like MFS transporter